MMVLSTKLPTGLGWPSFEAVPEDVVPHSFNRISKTEEVVPLPEVNKIYWHKSSIRFLSNSTNVVYLPKNDLILFNFFS